MPRLDRTSQPIATAHDWLPSRKPESFAGFALPTSNTTYTPNQFFDVCLPHYSRGVVRLVGYLIRKTLGWCDADGNPQEEEIFASYQELIHAGISREMIRDAVEEGYWADVPALPGCVS